MPYSSYTSSFTAVLGRRSSSAALTFGQMAATLNPPVPGVMLRAGVLFHREGGFAFATTVAGLGADVAVKVGEPPADARPEPLAIGEVLSVAWPLRSLWPVRWWPAWRTRPPHGRV